MRRLTSVFIITCVALFGAARSDGALQSQLQQMTAGYGGKVALFASDTHGHTVAINADTPVPTASVIKLAVLFEALKQIQAGTARFDDRLTMTAQDPVEGSGVLGQFDTPMQLTFKDALTMMVIVSDNTGTNLAIDHLGLQNIDRRIQWLGLRNTWLYKKVFRPAPPDAPSDQKQFGLGKTTAREMASLIERFNTCNLNAPGTTAPPSPADRKLCDTALAMLKNQSDRDAIPRYLSQAVANKTGALDDVRNDVGIVYAKSGAIVISAFTWDNTDQRWTPENAGQMLIARVAQSIVNAWQ